VIEKLNEMDKRNEARFTKLATEIKVEFVRIEERFNIVDEKFKRVEVRIEAVNPVLMTSSI